MDVPGIKMTFLEKDIRLAEKAPVAGLSEALAGLALIRYHMGGNFQLWNVYPPHIYGPLVYSNLRVQVEVVKTPDKLMETKLVVRSSERKKGLLWYLVALSPLQTTQNGSDPEDVKRTCSALIQGWWLDDQGDDKHDVELSSMELTRPAPIFWYEVTDGGKAVDWPEAVKKERERQRQAAFNAPGASGSRDISEAGNRKAAEKN